MSSPAPPDRSPADPAPDVLALRPIREDELAYFDRWSGPDSDPFNFFGFKTGRRLRAEFHENGLITPQSGPLFVVLDDRVIGDVGWREQAYGPPGACHAYNIGIRIVEEYRGKGHGTQAQRMLADYLFATYPINRVDAATDVDNVAEQRALVKAGFTREGILRGAQWRAGQWRDLVLYSRLRSDPS
jgi:RimJ/RimL family protein N-acetyltransferase